MQAAILKPILTLCIEGISICELSWKIQSIFPLPYTTIKRYLFYLIEYDVISYSGQRQKYRMELGGFGLLDLIHQEINQMGTDINDITITLE